MKILLVNSLYPTPLHPKIVGGAENSVKLLAEALVSRGHSVQVVRGLPPDATPTVENVDGVLVHGAPIRNIYWPFESKPPATFLKALWHFLDDWHKAPDI